LVQEVLARALRSICDGRFAGESQLSTWVTAIAQHVAMEELRAAARGTRPGSSSEPEIETPIDLEHQLEARSVLGHAARLLEAMDPATARIIVLYELIGHDLPEVAALTGLSITAVQSRLVRGRKALLRKLYEPDAESREGKKHTRIARRGGADRA
jgi:RNA polymerase sigma-70 factor (ECF subfamily)